MPSTESGQGDISRDLTEWQDIEPDPTPTLYESIVVPMPEPYGDGRSMLGGNVYRKYIFRSLPPGLKNGSIVCDHLGRHGRVKIVKKTDQLYYTALVSPIDENKLVLVLLPDDDGDPLAF